MGKRNANVKIEETDGADKNEALKNDEYEELEDEELEEEEFEDFESEDPDDEPLQECHGDHLDTVIDYFSPWQQAPTQPGSSWWDTHIRTQEHSIPNEQLLQDPTTQRWLATLAGLRRRGAGDVPRRLRAPQPGWSKVPSIPLFRDDEAGDEYQLQLDLYQRLPQVRCPSVADVPWEERADPLVQVRYRLPPPDSAAAAAAAAEPPAAAGTATTTAASAQTRRPPPPPTFIIPLGPLAVRTSRRHPDLYRSPEPLTERTDYLVALDAASPAMPLWILCAQRQLRERAGECGWFCPQLPVFGGRLLLPAQSPQEPREEGDEHVDVDVGCDVACILDSVHRLGARGADRPTFAEACELVRETCGVRDPAVLPASRAKMEELLGEPLPAEVGDSP